MSDRRYPEGVRAALHVMCGGGCYRPECGEPAIRFVDEVPEINLEIAHIHSLDDNGPRAIPTMPGPERNALSNLIWLCGPCHKRVDNDEVTYLASLLRAWKRDRERQPLEHLAGLRDLDAAKLEELLRHAMAGIRQDMSAFAQSFPELAAMLRETITGLPSLDPESLDLLASAATRLDLPEYAPMMHSAASQLDLPDYAPSMHDAASRLQLPEFVPMLAGVARDLDLPNQVSVLRNTADDLAGTVRTLSHRVSQINTSAQTSDPAYPDTVVIREHSPLLVRTTLVGVLGWIVIGVYVYLHVKGHL
jgi:hypothetical protein